MRKKLICILTIALMLTMCSCGAGSKADDTQAASNTTAPAEQSQGLEFQSNGDGTCTLTGFGDFSGKELTIPTKSPAGDTVTAIAEEALALSERNAYDACMFLETLIFDHADLTLNSYAVCDLINLKQILVKDSTITLNEHAFGCDSIEMVQVENSTLKIGAFSFASENFVGFTAKDSTLTFDEDAFASGNTKELVLTDCNTTIGKNAFFYSEQLNTFTVQGGALEIGEGAFAGCTGLAKITLNCPVSVGKSAFSDCKSLTGVQFGDGDVQLGDEAFSYCGQLESVSIGEADVEFNTDVFYGCPKNLVISLNGKSFDGNLEEILPIVEKVYTIDDLSITLSDGFNEYEIEGTEYALVSDTSGVLFMREAFSDYTDLDMDPNELTLTQYAQAVISANALGDIEVEEMNGIPYFIWDSNGATKYACVFRGTDAFWRVIFYSYTEDFAELLPQFEQWASGVTFG